MNGIEQHFTTPYHHRSNGRVERFNRTIVEGIKKQLNNKSLKGRIRQVLKVYNHVEHTSTGLSPTEALEPSNWDKIRRKQFDDRIKRNESKIRSSKRIKFKENDEVIIKEEIHKYKGQHLFKDIGIVKEVLGNDVYIIETTKNKLIKRYVDQLRIWNSRH